MKKTIYICGFLIMAMFSSCEEWFDIPAKSELKADHLFENEQGFRDALIGVYGSMAEDDLYGAQLTCTYLDVLGQYYSTAATALHNFQYAYAYDYSYAAEETRKDNIWKKSYNVIANINSLLGYIDDRKDIFSTGVYESIKGEALGLRAYIHFDLLRLFGAAPSMPEGLDRKAIPYVDVYTNQLFEQLTVREVLEKIAGDLNEARNLLMTADPIRSNDYDPDNLSGIWKGREYRMNYYAATALLARVLLYRNEAGDKGNAGVYAREVIESQQFPLITGDDLSSSDKNGFVQENIFALEYKGLKDNIVDKYFYVGNTNSNFLAINNSTLNNIYPSSLDMDYRRRWWVEESGSYNLIAKYTYSERIPLLKISEMYLIAAETAETIADANSYFNELQYHRGLPAVEITEENLTTTLLAEYAKEFVGEGQLFFAYKRLNNTVKPITKAVLDNSEATYVLPLPTNNTYFK